MRRIVEHRHAALIVAGCGLGALLITTAALTMQALAADRSARRASAKNMTHLATVAAWEMSRHLAADLEAAGRVSTAPAARLNGRVGRAPAAETLFSSASVLCNCRRLEVAGYFELRPGLPPRLTGDGWLPGDTTVVASIVSGWPDSVEPANSSDHHEGLEAHFLSTPGAQSRLLFTQPVRGVDGRLAATYGALVSSVVVDSFFAASVARASLLPESITERLPLDSLLQISVQASDRGTVYRTKGTAPLSEHVGRNLIGPLALGASVEARLRTPATAIMAGFVPQRATAPILLFIVTGLLTIAVGWAMVRHSRLDAMRAEFMAGVAHEFHTPLALISAYAETSANGRANDATEHGRFMALIVRESQRLSHLVDNVQRIASTGRSSPVLLREMSLSASVAEVCADFAVLAAAHGSDIVTDIQRNIEIRGDQVAIRNALLNVLDNAVRYGGAARRIHVSVTQAGGEAHVCVDDEGPGIAPNDRERVFDRYVRLTSALGPDAAAGSGIGLAIVRDIIAAHGGGVAIETAPTGGARVRLTWPVAA